MTIAKSIVESHGGEIYFDTEIERSHSKFSFHIFLPID